jgi:hypothetical protein
MKAHFSENDRKLSVVARYHVQPCLNVKAVVELLVTAAALLCIMSPNPLIMWCHLVFGH